MIGGGNKKTYKITALSTVDGCPTKFNVDARYTKSAPMAAAKAAVGRHCNLKRVRGQCTLYIEVQETDQDAKKNSEGQKKKSVYMIKRSKLAKPIVLKNFTINYKTDGKKVNSMPKCKTKSHKSSGPMKKTSRLSKNAKKGVRGKKRTQGKKKGANNNNVNLGNNNNYKGNNNNNKKGGGKKRSKKSRK
jgi:hypothetical protein